MNSVVFVPKISDVSKGKVDGGESKYASCVNSSIQQFNELAEKFPSDYEWVRISDEGFKKYANDISTSKPKDAASQINKLYWLDLLGQLEALMVMNCWRAADLARSTVNAINRSEVGVAAILSRSTLENSAFFLHAARKVYAIISELRDVNFNKDIVGGQEIEEFVIKVTFGSGKDSDETDHNAYNVLSAIQSIEKVYKKKGAEGIEAHYVVLSEIVHPNFSGRALYIKSDQETEEPGTFRTKICRSESSISDHVLIATVAALSWSMASQVSSSELMSGSIKELRNTLNQLS